MLSLIAVVAVTVAAVMIAIRIMVASGAAMTAENRGTEAPKPCPPKFTKAHIPPLHHSLRGPRSHFWPWALPSAWQLPC